MIHSKPTLPLGSLPLNFATTPFLTLRHSPLNFFRAPLQLLPTSLILFVAITLVSLPSYASDPRDRDGTKLQARSLPLATSHSDSLNPPADIADWFYVKIESPGQVSISLSTNQKIKLTLFDSSNSEKWSGFSSNNGISTKINVGAGIFFIALTLPPGSDSGERPYRLRVERVQ